MGGEAVPSLLAASLRKIPASNTTTSSSSIRFLGVPKHPGPDPSPNHQLLEELDESDVWASATSPSSDFSEPVCPADSLGADSVMPYSVSPAVSAHSPSIANGRRHHLRIQFGSEKFGLSAALADEPRNLVQQKKQAMDPSLSAATAARAIPMIRSGMGMEGSTVRSGSGKLFNMSAPVNVPAWPGKDRSRSGGGGGRYKLDYDVEDMDEREEEEDDEEGEMVPPHVMVARSHVTTFSVFEGVGRTLKGRDLMRVRNAVLQKAGFLD